MIPYTGCILLPRPLLTLMVSPDFDCTGMRIYHLYAQTEESRQDWVKAIKRAPYEHLRDTFLRLRDRLESILGQEVARNQTLAYTNPAVPDVEVCFSTLHLKLSGVVNMCCACSARYCQSKSVPYLTGEQRPRPSQQSARTLRSSLVHTTVLTCAIHVLTCTCSLQEPCPGRWQHPSKPLCLPAGLLCSILCTSLLSF